MEKRSTQVSLLKLQTVTLTEIEPELQRMTDLGSGVLDDVADLARMQIQAGQRIRVAAASNPRRMLRLLL